jgi:hypothetical protein
MRQETPGSTVGRWRSLWSTIPAANRRWILINALGVTAVINVVVNLTIAWLGTRGARVVPLWSTPLVRPSTVADTVGTTFMLPFVTALTCGAAVRRETRLGRICPLPDQCRVRKLFNRLPRGLLPGALRLALATLVTVGPLTLFALVLIRFGTVSVVWFLTFKVAYAVILGLVVTPVIALAAMSREEPNLRRQAA